MQRAVTLLLALALLASAGCSPAPQAVAPVTPPSRLSRIVGATPYETAASAVATLFPTGAGTVVIASGDADSFERGQLGASLAGVISKPLLFTETDRLPTATVGVIESLGATRAIIVGGTNAVGPAVEASLVAIGLETSRCGGEDIYEDAREVAKATRDLWRGNFDGKVFLVPADPVDWRIMYSVSSAAYSGVPILLTGRESIPPITLETMREVGASKVVVIGSDAYVEDSVLDQLRGLGMTTVRLSETARDGLSESIAEWACTAG